MIALSILLCLILLIITILGVPIRVRLESNPVCYIYWLFIKVRLRLAGGTVKAEMKLFNKKTGWFKKKKPAEIKKPTPPKKGKKKKKKPKISKNLVIEILSDVAVKKSLRVILRFCLRCVKSIQIIMLHCNIGLKDFYWQGILSGLSHSIPRTKNLQVSGNFLEENNFVVVFNISILGITWALLLLLLRFPYIKAYKLYRRVYL